MVKKKKRKRRKELVAAIGKGILVASDKLRDPFAHKAKRTVVKKKRRKWW